MGATHALVHEGAKWHSCRMQQWVRTLYGRWQARRRTAYAARRVCGLRARRTSRQGIAAWHLLTVATKLGHAVAAAEVRRTLSVHAHAWRAVAARRQAALRAHHRWLCSYMRRHMHSWHTLARRKATSRGVAQANVRARLYERRDRVFCWWRRQLGVRRAMQTLQLLWLEALVLACWRALVTAARRAKELELWELRLEGDLSQTLRADRTLCVAAHYCMVRWMLRIGAAAFNSWVRHRPA